MVGDEALRHAFVVCLIAATSAILAVGCASTDGTIQTTAPAPPPAPVAPPAPAPPPFDPRNLTAEIAFEEANANLTPEAFEEIDSFASKLRGHPKVFIHVVGYSDSSRLEKDKRWLAERRAKSVASYLVSRGIAANHVTLEGRASSSSTSEPAAGATLETAPVNLRRVDVSVR